MAADLKAGTHPRLLFPVAHLIDLDAADLIAPRNRRRSLPATERSQYALTQILRIGLHLSLPKTAGQVSHKLYTLKLEML